MKSFQAAQNVENRKKEVETALEGESKRSYEERLERLRKRGLPLVIEG